VTAQITPFLNFIAAAVLLCFVIAIADGEALTARCEVRGTAQNIVVHLSPSARNPLPAAGLRMHLHAGATEAARGSFGRRDGRLLSWIGLPP
jgi:hypothetical protein